MFVSADSVLAFRGERGTFNKRDEIQRRENIRKIKELYLNHKYKQCVALCEDSLKLKQTCPLHVAFLHFYAAICCESLGLIAHTFSTNKLLFLGQAREHFAAALSELPLPFRNDEPRQSELHDDSPQMLETHLTPLSLFGSASPTPVPQLLKNAWPSSDSNSDHGSHSSSDIHNNEHTFCKPNLRVSPSESDDESFSPCKLTFEQRKRLSQSLSVDHVIQSELLPKPLFAKKKSLLSPGLGPRALPPIPIQDPVLRKTALQTTLNPSVFAALKSSPITPRFNRIHDTFDPKFSTATYLRHMQKYNMLLSGFRTQLRQHVAAVDAAITKTETLQADRQRNRTNRLASFWSVKPEDVAVQEKKDRIERLRKGGWNVTKRAHGWKGDQYYEELRSRALTDVEIGE